MTMTAITDPDVRANLARVSDTLRLAADRLHLASLRQVESLADAPCLGDPDELLAVLVAVAGTCGPCH